MKNPTKWEYKTVEVKSKMLSGGIVPDIEEKLNAMGRRGWELVSSGHDTNGFGWFFFFKRAVH